MELLILSKLQWDLTAITAYDYLDHLLDELSSNDQDESSLNALRSRTEQLVASCAKEMTFLEAPASLIAAASLAKANALSGPYDLEEVIVKLERATKSEMIRIKRAVERIAEFVEDNLASSEGYFSSEKPSNDRDEDEEERRNGDNATPTEVFDVSALVVTWARPVDLEFQSDLEVDAISIVYKTRINKALIPSCFFMAMTRQVGLESKRSRILFFAMISKTLKKKKRK